MLFNHVLNITSVSGQLELMVQGITDEGFTFIKAVRVFSGYLEPSVEPKDSLSLSVTMSPVIVCARKFGEVLKFELSHHVFIGIGRKRGSRHLGRFWRSGLENSHSGSGLLL